MHSLSKNYGDDFFGTPLGGSSSFPFSLEVGDIILGKICKIDDDFVYISTGFKIDGRVPRNEFIFNDNQDIGVKVGDELEVLVEKITDSEDVFLSYKKVVEQRRWETILKALGEKTPIAGKIVKVVKGGFKVDLGVNRLGFLPNSQLGIKFSSENDIIGREMRFVVLEADKKEENIVLSHKELLKRETTQKEDEFLDTIQIGSIFEGKVTRITNFGAFVDIGMIEGLVHISELAWKRVTHPTQCLACGDIVKVKVIDLDLERKKISLSIKQVISDPWETVEQKFKIGDILEGTVLRILKFGAFVKLEGDFEGLIHISELGISSSSDISKIITPNQTVKVRIVNVDKKGKRIGLAYDRPKEDSVSQEMQKYMDTGQSGVKLGDVLGNALNEDT